MFILKQKTQSNKDDSWFIANWDGDPARTLKKENAKKYRTKIGAKKAITYYKKRYSHIRKIDLEILEIEEED